MCIHAHECTHTCTLTAYRVDEAIHTEINAVKWQQRSRGEAQGWRLSHKACPVTPLSLGIWITILWKLPSSPDSLTLSPLPWPVFPVMGIILKMNPKHFLFIVSFPMGFVFFFLFRKNQQSPISAPLLLPWAGKTKCTSDILLPGKTKEGKVPVSPLLPHPSPTKAHSSLFPSLSPSLSHCFHLQHNPWGDQRTGPSAP